MGFDAHKNFAISAVATAPSPATTGTSLVVTAGHGARFGTPPFNAVVWPVNTVPDPTNSEIVRVTALATDTLTIVRAQETGSGGPAARSIVVGDLIVGSPVTAKVLQDIEYNVPTRTEILLPPGWRDRWDTARPLVGSQVVRIADIGDSIAQGYGASSLTINSATLPNTSWFFRLRNKLVSLATLGGDFFSTNYSASWMTQIGGTYPGTPPWVVNGASPIWGGYGLIFSAIWVGTPAPALTFTCPYAGSADIWYRDAGAASPGWSWQKNGGAATNVNTLGGAYLKKVTIAGLAAGDTLTINALASGCCVIAGITMWADATKGFAFAHCTASGSMVSSLSTEQLESWGGKTAAGVWGNQGFPCEPDLWIVSFGINDCSGFSYASGPNQVRQSIQNLVDYIRRGRGGKRSDSTGIWILGNDPDPEMSDTGTTTGVSNPKDWPMFKDVIKEICWQRGVAVVDIDQRWGQTPRGQGFNTSTTDLHPNDTGYGDIESALESILL